MQLEYPVNSDTPVSRLPFSPSVRVGNFVFVSGQASVDSTGTIIPGTFEEEFRRAMENMRKVLAAAGSDFSCVIQTRNYIRDPQNLQLYNDLYREYFPKPYPARTTVTNCLPTTLLYEVECVAVVKQK